VVDGFKIFLSTTDNATIVPTGKESCMAQSISDLRLSIKKEPSPYRSTSGTRPSRFRDETRSEPTRPAFVEQSPPRDRRTPKSKIVWHVNPIDLETLYGIHKGRRGILRKPGGRTPFVIFREWNNAVPRWVMMHII
jgi:hypothetical protein